MIVGQQNADRSSCESALPAAARSCSVVALARRRIPPRTCRPDSSRAPPCPAVPCRAPRCASKPLPSSSIASRRPSASCSHRDLHDARARRAARSCAAPPARCDRCRSCAPPADLRRRRRRPPAPTRRCVWRPRAPAIAAPAPGPDRPASKAAAAAPCCAPRRSSPPPRFLISSALAATASRSPRADQVGEVRHLHQHAGQRLAHLVVQFARDGAALLFLRLHQARRELLQSRALRSPVRWRFSSAQDLADAEGGQQQAEPDGQRDGDGQAAAELRKNASHPQLAVRSTAIR